MPPLLRVLSVACAVLLSILAVIAAPNVAHTQQRELDDVPVIAAASTLQFALPDIAVAFQEDTGQTVRLSFGATGNLVRQIRAGAPYQLLLAADETYVVDLARDGITPDMGLLYAQGRLVLIAPKGSTLAVDGTLDGLEQALVEGRITRFAIANPDHAPYGMRAREVLQHRGLWDPLQPLLVLGENVSQTAQFATTGNADGGIIAYSLALAPQVAALGDHALIPAEWHAPLNQRMVLLEDAGPVAQAFFAYLQSPPARDILARYGFTTPGR
ncbi:MAG: molybdate ABC transporter substrate-binding protein [Octadecabacter sp.]|nr:molybdate ABC transporter substrate-binding protein [Octadecabacter sp.]